MSSSAPRRIERAGPAEDQRASMDRMYRVQRHIYDATRRYYLLGREPLLREMTVPPGGRVLEVGCGTGRNLVSLAKAHPGAMLFGIDISQEMLKTARRSIEHAGLSGRIRVQQGDALSFDPGHAFGTASFDRVYFSYTLSMIPEWRVALAHAATLLTPDGELHAADFGDCKSWPAGLRAVLLAWLARFHVTPRQELGAAFEQIAAASGRQSLFSARYASYAWLCRMKAAAAPV